MKRFWEVVYDDNAQTMEVIGTSSNDTLLTNNVVEMQKAGFKVRCNTPSIETREEEIKLPHYELEKNLYGRLLDEYQIKTGRQLKRW
jgi:hypothetical protein